MNKKFEPYFFYVTNNNASIKLLLRRTHVRLNTLRLYPSEAYRQLPILCMPVPVSPKIYGIYRLFIFSLLLSCCCTQLHAQRQDILLNSNWQTFAFEEKDTARFSNIQTVTQWQTVNVPHNWDAYDGYRRLLHGNKHGSAWYRKSFMATQQKGKRYFLFFEGVGSYATVWLNGRQVGYHAGGRTTFTIDVTQAIVFNKKNNLVVRADHPANIKNLPWVCGGCSDERGFSEGSQPMGIFRPVHLVVTNETRIQPFGVHVWNDQTVSGKSATVYIETTVKNYSDAAKESPITIITQLLSKEGNLITEIKSKETGLQGKAVIQQAFTNISNPHLWSLENPYLYTIVTTIVDASGNVLDKQLTLYGIRSIKWDRGKTNRFFLNGKPVFINGIAEYEHLLGNSHAFTHQQVASRVKMVQQLGFNAFRDAHQPHNLLYQQYWDSIGVLSWTQLSAHVWYDTKDFRENFKTLLKEWVIERRNSPSIILWGLQNESKLPKDFAEECTALIRSLDPTASSQRLVTTCNGGEGTDWDVPQNWTGTYGGDPFKYNEDVKRQVLIGEYGAWRTLDLHTEGNFKQNGAVSEDRFTQLMETKIRLAESVKDSAAGHFHWLLTSHDNPGRVQGGEGLRELDRIGPVNYKGLLTPWEEPTDAYYMYKSNYASKEKDAMVYIVSHTWPDRWTTVGKKDSIIVYSNCDEVELLNDVNNISLGRKKKQGIGTHFQWDGVDIRYNILYAVGYVNGKAVVKDCIVPNHLPQSPRYNDLNAAAKNITKPQQGYNYIYRINCGGANYTDENGNTWLADRALPTNNEKRNINYWFSTSWTNDFPGMPSFFASQRKTNSPIAGTRDWQLLQTFRYGREQLKYEFPLPDGEYLIELYLIEPWLGIGTNSNCKAMRLFDVAINNKTVLHDVDIWNEVGSNTALKKTIKARITGGKMVVSFPAIAAGQAIVSAIAIASLNKNIVPAKSLPSIIEQVQTTQQFKLETWCDNGRQQFMNNKTNFVTFPANLYGADYVLMEKNNKSPVALTVNEDADVFVAIPLNSKPAWLNGFEDTKTFVENDDTTSNRFPVYRRRYKKGNTIAMNTTGQTIAMSIFVLPVTNMQPAYDLKPTTSYKPLQAKISVDAERTTVNTKDAITFNANDATMEWNITTGVADVYSITIRYANTTGKQLKASMQLLQTDGTLMKEETLSFTPSTNGKWNYVATNTGSMVNAGNYVIRIKATDATGLSISALDIQ